MNNFEFWIDWVDKAVYILEVLYFWVDLVLFYVVKTREFIQSIIPPISFGSFAHIVENGLLWYFTSINLTYTFFLLIAFWNIIVRVQEVREEDTTQILKSDSLPTILFVIPLHNEADNALLNLTNILSITYRYKQVIAINDGSTDNTLDILKERLQLFEVPKHYQDELPCQKVKQVYQSKLYPEVTVIDKEQGGKFDAVNAGINAVPTPFFVVLDADTFVDSKLFEALVRPILTSRKTVAVGASIRIMNGCEIAFNRIKTSAFPQSFLPAAQSLEYLRSFCLRDGLDMVNGVFVIAGAFSIFPRDLVIQAGGFSPSKGEDAEIIVRLHRVLLENKVDYRIKYFPDPVAYTLAPETVKELSSQRVRWHVGLLDAIWLHKKVFFNPKYKAFGFLWFPFWFIAEAFEPLVEVFGYTYIIVTACLGTLHTRFFLLLMAVSLGYTVLYTIFALLVEEFTFRQFPSLRSLWMLLLANFVENIGYRQMNLYWRVKGLILFFADYSRVRKLHKFVQNLCKKAYGKISKREELK